jgi:hypothetical protein
MAANKGCNIGLKHVWNILETYYARVINYSIYDACLIVGSGAGGHLYTNLKYKVGTPHIDISQLPITKIT